ncbi:MAG: peptidylprolyl isomerase [Acidobacteriota bacterium]|nr:peptidylprolyl isomerase [Acidobacteriota bacterium]
MTLRQTKYAAVCGLGLVALSGVLMAQAPRYQSPFTMPSAPKPQITLPPTTAITPNGTVVEDVIARINDQIITRTDFERSQKELLQELQQQNTPEAEIDQRERDLLRDKIDQQLLLSRAKELGLNADAEVIRRLDEIRKQNHLDSMEDLEKAARQQGVQFEDFKANIRDSILTQQVVRDEVGRKLQVTEAQERAFYEAHKNEYVQPEQVRLSEILVPIAADAKDDDVAKAKAKADGIADQLKAGAKFEDLAKQNSGGQTAATGGDLGLFKRGALAKVLEDQTFSLPEGQWTAPIRTRQGFVILKVTEHHNAGVPPLKEVEPQVQEEMYMAQMQPALRAYLTNLRNDAYIDLKPGFVDTGASGKETKPVFTAYAAPVAKKKKVTEKKRFERAGAFSNAAPVETKSKKGKAEAATAVAETGKKKKVHREKIRFGQAPRNSLPGDSGSVATTEGTPGNAAAPGTQIAPVQGENQVVSANDVDADPLAPKPTLTGKRRFSDREQQIQAEKKAKLAARAREKAIETPAPISADEKATQQTQAAPLGLNGDTAKKTKKKRAKGEKKQRLQTQPQQPPPPPQEPTPYRHTDTPAGAAAGTQAPAGGTQQ